MDGFVDRLFGLKGKVAALIGGGGHLCSRMALGLAGSGVSIAVMDRNKEDLKEIVNKIREGGGNAIPVVLDVTNKKNHERALERILAKYSRVDILINGAGINAPTPFLEITQKEWQSILNVHLTGTLFACQVFGKHMVEKRRGSIVNISSTSAGPPLSKAFTYSVAKAGIKNLTQNLAREWAPYNVRVNALRPGFFPTEWSMKNFITPQRQKAIWGHTPMGRYGRPEELLGAVLWLCSDAASFVTGAEIAVDGGFSCMTI